ncbi:Uncharacterised protein [Dermatophilus congolensis]|uniref:Uncharacterized protein n=1 Tax=Dermatophilus congolensis TaxID=1863 RepID=A0AA46BPT7_9MICO|nr:Uncharacterised protein [Dermatophilus congolensis]
MTPHLSPVALYRFPCFVPIPTGITALPDAAISAACPAGENRGVLACPSGRRMAIRVDFFVADSQSHRFLGCECA